MIDVAKHAQRILAAMRKDRRSERIFPGYVPFDEVGSLNWWSAEICADAQGTVLGVHENQPDTRAGAIVITEMGLVVLGQGSDSTWLPYSGISGWEKLSKEPISRSLHIRTKQGEQVELLFPGGRAFAFVQFLSSAIREHARVSLKNDLEGDRASDDELC